MDCKGGNHAIAHNEIATSSPIARDAGMFSNVLADRREPIGEASSPKGDGLAAG